MYGSGTGMGLDRFDGNNLLNYTFSETSGEPRRITSVAEGSDGRIFVGSYRGLFEGLVPGRLVPVLSDKINFRVNALVYDRSSKLYIGTQQGYVCVRHACRQARADHDKARCAVERQRGDRACLFGAATAFGWPPITICITSALPTIGIISRPVDADGVIRSIIGPGDRVFLGCYRSGLAIFDIATATFSRLL